jgi:hypothetical protein
MIHKRNSVLRCTCTACPVLSLCEVCLIRDTISVGMYVEDLYGQEFVTGVYEVNSVRECLVIVIYFLPPTSALVLLITNIIGVDVTGKLTFVKPIMKRSASCNQIA